MFWHDISEVREKVTKLGYAIDKVLGNQNAAKAEEREKRDLPSEFDDLKRLSTISEQIYEAMISFVKAAETMEQRAHYKIDAIYKALCEKEAKSKKKKKAAK